MGIIFESNLLLGLNFHFLKAVHPIAARPTTEATTMIAMRADLLSPDELVDELSASEVADAVED